MRRRVPIAVRRLPHAANADPATGLGFLCPILPGSSSLQGSYRLGILYQQLSGYLATT